MQTFDALHITKSFDFCRTMSAITEYFLNFNRTQKAKKKLPRQSISASFRWLNINERKRKSSKIYGKQGVHIVQRTWAATFTAHEIHR